MSYITWRRRRDFRWDPRWSRSVFLFFCSQPPRCREVSAAHFQARLRVSTSDESMCKCRQSPADLWEERQRISKIRWKKQRKKKRRIPSLMNGWMATPPLPTPVKSACLNFLLHQSETKAWVCVDKSNYWCFSALPFMSASSQTKRHRGIVKILFSCLSNNKKSDFCIPSRLSPFRLQT